jgi:hypothetical protein
LNTFAAAERVKYNRKNIAVKIIVFTFAALKKRKVFLKKNENK